jgi:hypothetical protein
MVNGQAGSNGKSLPTIGQEAGPSIDQNGRSASRLQSTGRAAVVSSKRSNKPNQISQAWPMTRLAPLAKTKPQTYQLANPSIEQIGRHSQTIPVESDGTINRTSNEATALSNENTMQIYQQSCTSPAHPCGPLGWGVSSSKMRHSNSSRAANVHTIRKTFQISWFQYILLSVSTYRF